MKRSIKAHTDRITELVHEADEHPDLQQALHQTIRDLNHITGRLYENLKNHLYDSATSESSTLVGTLRR